MKLRLRYISAILLLLAFSCTPQEDPFITTPYSFNLPSDFPEVREPSDNPTTVEGAALGRMLFYDPILSNDSTMSCASCHNQSDAFTDNGEQFSTGIDGIEGTTNSMQLINLAWSRHFFWDGRRKSLEDQALDPVESPTEMHSDWDQIIQRLQNQDRYIEGFRKAFGEGEINSNKATKAIAQFERTLISYNSKFDQYMRGEGVLTSQELNGLALFASEQTNCFHCHSPPHFSNDQFHNNGLDDVFDENNEGYFVVTGDEKDLGKFKSTSLRNIEFTAPYMHDGRFSTLEAVIDHYNEGIKDSETLDIILNQPGTHNGMGLSASEKSDLIAFLKTLTDTDFLTNPEFQDPF